MPMRILLLAMAATLALVTANAAPNAPALVPLPAQMTLRDGPGFTLTEASALVADEAFAQEAAFAARELARATGFALKVTTPAEAPKPSGNIVFRKVEGLGPEAYRLTTGPEGATIEATTPAGAFYGFQTLRQLLPAEIYAKTPQTGVAWQTPAVAVEDAPRLKWRGVLVDDCRHFMGEQAFRDMVDAMAAHKLNILHWHLTDDQGWRIEIKRYPQIVLNGARRAQSSVRGNGWKGDGKPYGWYYYTQEQIRDLVAYAAERHVTVVPEIEMPGHALTLLSAFPDLGCTGGPYAPRCFPGVEKDIVCAGNDRVLEVYENILEEVLALFPSPYIHCGGDEAPKARWKECPKCQRRIREQGLRDEHQLQTWFVQHFANWLKDRGRRLIGWDEILEGGLPQGAAIMSWLGTQGGIKAAKAGHEAIMVPHYVLYLDYAQGLPDDPHEYMAGGNTLRRVYGFNPTAGVPEEFHRFIIGTQGNLWSEYIRTPAEQQWKAWPRAAAVAEVAWTPQALRRWEDFRGRMEEDRRRLARLGLNVAPLPERPAATWASGEIPTEWTVRTWDLTPAPKAGTYVVTFQYQSGASRLDIRKAELLADGQPVATDAHAGQTGGSNKANVYRLTLPPLPAGARVALRAEVRTDGSSDSVGEILLHPAP